MCLLPLAVRTELAILDKQQSYIFLINWRQLHCIFVSFFVQKKIWLQEEWGALFPAGWHGHRRPSFLLPPFRFSSITNSQRGSLLYPNLNHFPDRFCLGLPPSYVFEQSLTTSLSRWVFARIYRDQLVISPPPTATGGEGRNNRL